MAHNLEFNRLSNFVDGIVDRKVQSLSMTFTSSVGFMKTMVSQASTHANNASQFAQNAGDSAQDAAQSAASSLIVWNQFTSTYVGIHNTDPLISSINNPLVVGAWYIRRTDGRLRYVSSMAGNGNPVYSDATVAADASSILTGGVGVFLALDVAQAQTVKGAVTFQSSVIAPRVTNWTTQQVATAIDVNARANTLQAAIDAETARAIAAENSVGGGKVSKIGDIMTGPLSIEGSGDAVGVNIRETGTNGRNWRINSGADGRIRIIDTTSSTERLTITPAGVATLTGSLNVSGATTASDVTTNRTDNNDSGYSIQQNGVTRWRMRRSNSTGQFYIARMSNTGVLVDSPILINESDGLITQNQTTVKTDLTISGPTIATGGVLGGDSVANGLTVKGRNNNKAGYISFGNSGQLLGCEPDDPTLRYNGIPISGGGGGDPGDIKWTAASTAPSGWLKANGDIVSRTTYAALFTKIGTRYGSGDGSTTFKLPDLRGEFVRGWDDGRGVDLGRALGSSQTSQNLAHVHSGTASSGGSHSHNGSVDTAGSHTHTGTAAIIGNTGGGGNGTTTVTYTSGGPAQIEVNTGGTHSHTLAINSAGDHNHGLNINSAGSHSHSLTINSEGGTEARPRNVAMLALIKF